MSMYRSSAVMHFLSRFAVQTLPLTGSPTDGTMLTKTTKLVRWDALQRT